MLIYVVVGDVDVDAFYNIKNGEECKQRKLGAAPIEEKFREANEIV